MNNRKSPSRMTVQVVFDTGDLTSAGKCEGEDQYIPGWEPIDDGEPSECSHEPDAHTIAFASQTDLICDVSCGKCGMSGSFRVDPTSIQWEE